jgi:hypothetical protein
MSRSDRHCDRDCDRDRDRHDSSLVHGEKEETLAARGHITVTVTVTVTVDLFSTSPLGYTTSKLGHVYNIFIIQQGGPTSSLSKIKAMMSK